MKYDIRIDESLKGVYPEIRLCCLRFHTDVKPSDNTSWKHMNEKFMLSEGKTAFEKYAGAADVETWTV